MITLSVAAADRSTYKVTASFEDSAGAAVIPSAITWTLTDRSGTVVNGRDAVAIGSPAASVDIVLSGDDTAYELGAWRILTVEATYSSDEGNDLPLNEECIFPIENLINI